SMKSSFSGQLFYSKSVSRKIRAAAGSSLNNHETLKRFITCGILTYLPSRPKGPRKTPFRGGHARLYVTGFRVAVWCNHSVGFSGLGQDAGVRLRTYLSC
ncbi:hypothetical protein, partial [Paraburkholderia humisilvae]